MSGRSAFATTITKADSAESSLAYMKFKVFKTNIKRDPLFVLMMRLNLKTLLFFLTVAVIITLVIYMNCSFPHGFVKRWDGRFYQIIGDEIIKNKPHKENANSHLLDIECFINQEYTIRCKRDNEANEVYVPFSFIQNYFDVNGVMSNGNSVTDGDADSNMHQVKIFNWMHSNAKVNLPKGKYNPHGIFMYFENYNVEVRDRVKCVSAIEGVPVSTQWEKRGYFYPTQIAQFALSHYSKNITETEPRINVLEDADANRVLWTIPKLTNISRIWHPKFNTSVIQYETLIGFSAALSYNIKETVDLLLSINILLVTNSSSVMVMLQNRITKATYQVHYIPADILISVQGDNIYYGLGKSALNKWRHLTRDLHIDVQKGLIAEKKFQKLRRNELNVLSIAFLGIGFFDNMTFSTSNHLAHFYDAAEWFVNNQDKRTGGWPNPVRRNLNGFAELKSGWLSAMGQGHAISVLARAYWHSGGDKRYLKAASLALKPFRILSQDGGVLAKFMEKYYWYEEYPTTPPSFVLNGFIYSLLGLYDLNSTAPIGSEAANEAGKLFYEGIYSLKKMLLFYDTGSGTTYDLRHISLGVAPNLARWDYHSAHVNQLLLLATIDSDPTITQTAERWKGYMFGKRAKHN